VNCGGGFEVDSTLFTVLGTILVATITVTGGIVGAAISFYLTKRDIGLSGTDNSNTFCFRLVSAENSDTSDNQEPSKPSGSQNHEK
jgi:hypothetical protein